MDARQRSGMRSDADGVAFGHQAIADGAGFRRGNASAVPEHAAQRRKEVRTMTQSIEPPAGTDRTTAGAVHAAVAAAAGVGLLAGLAGAAVAALLTQAKAAA